jgi:hypothetical protein
MSSRTAFAMPWRERVMIHRSYFKGWNIVLDRQLRWLRSIARDIVAVIHGPPPNGAAWEV